MNVPSQAARRRALPVAVGLSVGLGAVAAGCVGRSGREVPQPAPVRYHVSVQAQFETSGQDGEGAALSALQGLGSRAEALELDLSLRWAREYRDGSEGLLVAFDRAAGTARGPEGERRIDPHPLQGRSVELRRFPDGELLRVGLLEHVAGGDRGGELWAPVLAALSPRPPDIRGEGEHAARTARWPLFLNPGRGAWETIDADWTLLPMARIGSDRCWNLRYAGDWRTEGGDAAASPSLVIRAQGRAEGEVWISRADHGLVRHTLRWSRRLHLPLSVGAGAGGAIDQTQTYTAVLERSP
jgi:hypothetical protein